MHNDVEILDVTGVRLQGKGIVCMSSTWDDCVSECVNVMRLRCPVVSYREVLRVMQKSSRCSG